MHVGEKIADIGFLCGSSLLHGVDGRVKFLTLFSSCRKNVRFAPEKKMKGGCLHVFFLICALHG